MCTLVFANDFIELPSKIKGSGASYHLTLKGIAAIRTSSRLVLLNRPDKGDPSLKTDWAIP